MLSPQTIKRWTRGLSFLTGAIAWTSLLIHPVAFARPLLGILCGALCVFYVIAEKRRLGMMELYPDPLWRPIELTAEMIASIGTLFVIVGL